MVQAACRFGQGSASACRVPIPIASRRIRGSAPRSHPPSATVPSGILALPPSGPASSPSGQAHGVSPSTCVVASEGGVFAVRLSIPPPQLQSTRPVITATLSQKVSRYSWIDSLSILSDRADNSATSRLSLRTPLSVIPVLFSNLFGFTLATAYLLPSSPKT